MLPNFKNAKDLSGLIAAYFESIEGEYHIEETAGKKGNEDELISKKIWGREPSPATFSGLAYFLGFNSLEEFEEYKLKGEFYEEVSRAHLRIQVVYERKLHGQSCTGVIYAINGMGRKEKAIIDQGPNLLEIVLIETGPKPAENEKDVVF